jgi:hypothetical protein
VTKPGPWRHPDPPDPGCDPGCPGHNPWPVRLVRRDVPAWERDGRLPFRQTNWPTGQDNPRFTRVVQLCVKLPGGHHADVFSCGKVAWCWLARCEADAHAADASRMVQLELANPGAQYPMFPLPDGGANLVLYRGKV